MTSEVYAVTDITPHSRYQGRVRTTLTSKAMRFLLHPWVSFKVLVSSSKLMCLDLSPKDSNSMGLEVRQVYFSKVAQLFLMNTSH